MIGFLKTLGQCFLFHTVSQHSLGQCFLFYFVRDRYYSIRSNMKKRYHVIRVQQKDFVKRLNCTRYTAGQKLAIKYLHKEKRIVIKTPINRN